MPTPSTASQSAQDDNTQDEHTKDCTRDMQEQLFFLTPSLILGKRRKKKRGARVSVCVNVLQGVAGCGRVLRCVAVCCTGEQL